MNIIICKVEYYYTNKSKFNILPTYNLYAIHFCTNYVKSSYMTNYKIKSL